MSTDLTVASARAERDALAPRTDVLDKVGVLRTLPGDLHVTTDMVAEFYQVPVGTVRALVLDNRVEIETDGYRVVTRSAFEESYPKQLTSSASRIALFPRRAVLRVGMLLRDSPVARRVRDYLLDTESGARTPVSSLSDDELIDRALEVSKRRVAALTERVAELEPQAEVAAKLLDAEGDLSVRDAAQSLTRAGITTGQQRLFAELAERSWIFRAGDGRWRVMQYAIEHGYMSVLPQSHYHPKTGELVLDPPQPRVTPKGLQRLLSDLPQDDMA
ncbi:phage antirepressor KilAC domain-containing protein [Nocardia terpenica]|uniref:phage antirepressor KilAC domain-containing protein n=1 Tax=Nocardia terpenica TaxID=455432 RepID=UPI002FE27AF6